MSVKLCSHYLRCHKSSVGIVKAMRLKRWFILSLLINNNIYLWQLKRGTNRIECSLCSELTKIHLYLHLNCDDNIAPKCLLENVQSIRTVVRNSFMLFCEIQKVNISE